jgi:hypothetical protein
MSATQIHNLIVKWDNTKKRFTRCPFMRHDADEYCSLLSSDDKIVLCEYDRKRKANKACPAIEHILVELE